VLVAMGYSAARARASVRFSLGRYNTAAEVDYALECLPAIIEKLRANVPAQSEGAVCRG
jgi:cysteine desulfurase